MFPSPTPRWHRVIAFGMLRHVQAPTSLEMFNDGALVFANGSDALRFGPKTGPSLAFEFHNLPDLALWRPTGAPFLCIEPWHGTASYVGDGPQIAQRPNSITLPPKATIQFGYSVAVNV